MSKLAINGGTPVRTEDFPEWPVYDEKDYSALKRVLESRRWFSGMLGSDEESEVGKFEKEFREHLKVNHVAAVSNGSAALEISLKSVGVGAGDEVIIPAYTFVATATAVLRNNAVPIMVDIEPDYYCIDPDEIEAAITSKTAAIVPVHFGGQIANMDRINSIAESHEIPVVEDAAHAHGSVYKGKYAGNFGDAGCFSFQESKVLTSGEGGAVVTNDDGLDRLVRSYRSCGRNEGRHWYEHFRLGGNYRMTEFQGALLQSQLDRLPDQVRKRTRNGKFLSDSIAKIAGFDPVKDSPGMDQNSHYYYIVNIDRDVFPEADKRTLIDALNAEGIPANEGYPFPLTENAMFREENWDKYGSPYTSDYYGKEYNVKEFGIPVTERACRDTIIIPQRVLLADREEVQDVVDSFAKLSSELISG